MWEHWKDLDWSERIAGLAVIVFCFVAALAIVFCMRLAEVRHGG